MRKPFNLEEALAGKPVVTRGGYKVSQLTKFNGITKFSLVGVVEDGDHCGPIHPQTWQPNGRFSYYGESGFDLFMEVEEEKQLPSGYVNVWKNEDGYSLPYATFHYTREAAQAERTTSCSGHKKRLVATAAVIL
jgi:hypothetical protein